MGLEHVGPQVPKADLFHSATANRNTDVYIFTLILNRGSPFPVGVSEDTYRLIS